MKICILGGGWYGCHLALQFLRDGHQVELHEIADRLFSGASGGNPARLHLGPHYPRSRLTRAFCQEHHAKFMKAYGHLTRAVPINIYAIAAADSLVDFGTYTQVLRGEIEFVTIERPDEFGLENVEGAILCGERHIVIDRARAYFWTALNDAVHYESATMFDAVVSHEQIMLNLAGCFDWVIDCTFCANGNTSVHRFEPCVTALVEGPTDRAVTIMDGPFPSLYPWDEEKGLCSLTSALFTPFAKLPTYKAAREHLNGLSGQEVSDRCQQMLAQIGTYYPAALDLYKVVEAKLTIRAQPRSGADARLVDVARVGDRMLRVRAGKIDAILHAEQLIREIIANA